MRKILLIFLVFQVFGCLNNLPETIPAKDCGKDTVSDSAENTKSKDIVSKKVWNAEYFLEMFAARKCEKGYGRIDIGKDENKIKGHINYNNLITIINKNNELIKFDANDDRMAITKLNWSLLLNDRCSNLPFQKVSIPVDYSIDKTCHSYLEKAYHWVYEVFKDREFYLLSISKISKYDVRTSPLFSYEKLFFIDAKTGGVFYSLCQKEEEKSIPFENILEKYNEFPSLPQKDKEKFIKSELLDLGKREMLRNFLLHSAREGSVYKVRNIFDSGILKSNPGNIKEEMLENAVKTRQLGMAKFLLKNGTKLNHQPPLLLLAKETGFKEMIKLVETASKSGALTSEQNP